LPTRISTGSRAGPELRHLYRLVVFESHGEYVTSHMFDITEQYRNLGGHLAFLPANDFFREVVISGASMTLIGRFRDFGRPEAALIGAQYIDWYRNRYPNQPYRVAGAGRVPWLFARTGLRDGSLIPGYYGIEIDGTTPASPPGTTVVATIPNIFPCKTADMTYYTTASGAQVFDAGTINFDGSAANLYVAGCSPTSGPICRGACRQGRPRGCVLAVKGSTGMTGVRELPAVIQARPA
jgi:N,N-dimethylformamidase beta subunit-like protein